LRTPVARCWRSVVGVGLLASVLVELAWQVLVSGGQCTGCNAAGDPGGIAGVGGAGGAGAASSHENPPDKGRFDNWLVNLLGSQASPATSFGPASAPSATSTP
jgi:hypothetical protein